MRVSSRPLVASAARRRSLRVRAQPDIDRAPLERALAEVSFPPTVPPASQLLVDAEGDLWARHYWTFSSAGPETWSVFSRDGYLLGTVETPERLQARQIGRDFLLGIWTDDLDVRFVRKYALER
ncbi:MAG TPA: hypothetical protein VFQ22_05955 [Longimicrobiales bacterium]|nr:hypothetical protein [Longimicrobiales bacterium]